MRLEKPTSTKTSKYIILRERELTNKVPTFLLNVSEVFADLADDEDTVMVSDDFVVFPPVGGPEIRSRWMTRSKKSANSLHGLLGKRGILSHLSD